MNALEEDLQNLIGKPVALDELAEMSRMFTGAMKCLMVCHDSPMKYFSRPL